MSTDRSEERKLLQDVAVIGQEELNDCAANLEGLFLEQLEEISRSDLVINAVMDVRRCLALTRLSIRKLADARLDEPGRPYP
jgi:hypothetical protein